MLEKYTMLFETHKAALLLIDLQYGFCSPDGHTGKKVDVSGFASVLRSAERLSSSARKAGMPIIFTTMAFSPDYKDGGLTTSDLRPNIPIENALRADNQDSEIMPVLKIESQDILIKKQRYSVMIKTSLPEILEQRNIECLVVGGVTTSMCVESSVRDLAMMDYKVFVIPECCGDIRQDFHDRSMELFSKAFGRVVNENEMISTIEEGEKTFPHIDF